jgi:glycerophosphoryl diester phosphodiesterase
MLTLKEFSLTDNKLIVAHRGSSGTAPENTLAAFKDAIEAGANMVEADIQFTKDGEIVIYHDLIPLNLPNSIDNLNYNQISSIEIGSMYDEKFSGQKIPRLVELINLIKGKLYLMIEIKKPSEPTENLIRLSKLIEQTSYSEYTLFASFYYDNLINLIQINHKLNTAIIKKPLDSELPSRVASETGAKAYVCSINELNQTIANDTSDNNLFLGVYAVDTNESLQKAMDYKVRAIGTNYPEKIKTLMNSYTSD